MTLGFKMADCESAVRVNQLGQTVYPIPEKRSITVVPRFNLIGFIISIICLSVVMWKFYTRHTNKVLADKAEEDLRRILEQFKNRTMATSGQP